MPIVLVSLGLGSVIATAFEAAPWLGTIGRHKGLAVFACACALLLASSARAELLHVEIKTLGMD